VQESDNSTPPHTCQFEVSKGRNCRRRTSEGETHCWQHARGFRSKLRSLTKSQKITFWITFASGLVGLCSLIVTVWPKQVPHVSAPIIEIDRQWMPLGLAIGSGEEVLIVPLLHDAAVPENFINSSDRSIQWPRGIDKIRWPNRQRGGGYNGDIGLYETMYRYSITNAGNVAVFDLHGKFTGRTSKAISFEVYVPGLEVGRHFTFYVVNESDYPGKVSCPTIVSLHAAGRDETELVRLRRSPQFPEFLDLIPLSTTGLKWTGSGSVEQFPGWGP